MTMNTVFKKQERKSNKIIVFANQKGGVGKTSLCASVCNRFAKVRHKFCAVDADAQRSLWKLREENKQDHPDLQEPYFIYHFDDLDSEKYTTELMEDLRDVDGDVFIDAPGSLSKSGMIPLIKGADVVIIPYSYDENTVLSTIAFIRFLKRIFKDNETKMPQIIFVQNRYNAKWGRKGDFPTWELTDKGFAEFGTLAPRVALSSEMTRVNTFYNTPKLQELIAPFCDFLDENVFKTNS